MKKFIWFAVFIVLMAPDAFAFRNKKCRVDMRVNFETAIQNTQNLLEKKRECAGEFEKYFSDLVTAAKGYPATTNKQKFSDFLLWASNAGIVSRKRAEELYNRYFSVKFLAMMGDYNLCSSICSNETAFRAGLEVELADKETGLVMICRDTDSFAKANKLFGDSLVVVSATCRACANTAKN